MRRLYKRAAEAAGLRPLKLHGLRHATGSVLARSLPLWQSVTCSARRAAHHQHLPASKIDAAAIVAVNAAFGVVDAATEEATV